MNACGMHLCDQPAANWPEYSWSSPPAPCQSYWNVFPGQCLGASRRLRGGAVPVRLPSSHSWLREALASTSEEEMTKVLCVLYDDPVGGYPKSYARDTLPLLSGYPGGQTLPTPQGIDFTPGHLLGSVSGELGLRPFLERLGHTLVVTSDKAGADSRFDRELPDT